MNFSFQKIQTKKIKKSTQFLTGCRICKCGHYEFNHKFCIKDCCGNEEIKYDRNLNPTFACFCKKFEIGEIEIRFMIEEEILDLVENIEQIYDQYFGGLF